jgi:hypothetical protein
MPDVAISADSAGRGLVRIAQAVRRWWRQRDPAHRVSVLPADAEVRIESPSGGEASLRLHLVNLSGRHLTIDRFDLDHWTLLSYVMPDTAPVAKGLGATLPKRSVQSLQVTLPLNPATVERVKEATDSRVIDPLCGNLALRVSGRLQLKETTSPVHASVEWQHVRFCVFWMREAK